MIASRDARKPTVPFSTASRQISISEATFPKKTRSDGSGRPIVAFSPGGEKRCGPARRLARPRGPPVGGRRRSMERHASCTTAGV
jgi:hypothetical protein